MRMLDPSAGDDVAVDGLNLVGQVPHVQATFKLQANDGATPSHNTLYFVSDIRPLLNDEQLFASDTQACATSSSHVSWVVMSFINGVAAGGAWTGSQVPGRDPPTGTIIVANGSTPRADMEQDYHNWYEQEHAGKLALVPGWQFARRYKLRKAYGEAQTANFYGVNFYDEVNGLGGPEWKAGVTEWTKRIRDQAAKPNVRRVWKVKEVSRT